MLVLRQGCTVISTFRPYLYEIMFQRSSASTPRTNFKMCSDNGDCPLAPSKELGVVTRAPTVAPRNLFPQSAEDKEFATLKYEKHLQARAKHLRKQLNQTIKEKQLLEKRIKAFSNKVKTTMEPHAGFVSPIIDTFERVCIPLGLTLLPEPIIHSIFGDETVKFYTSKYWREILLCQSIDLTRVFNMKTVFFKHGFDLVKDAAIANLDAWVSYFVAISKVTDITQFLSITYLLLRSLGLSMLQPYIKYMFKQVDQLTSLVCDMFVPHDGEFFDFKEFISVFHSGIDIFNRLKTSKAIDYIIKLFSMIVSAGCCDAFALNFSMGGYKVFKEGFLRSLERSKPTLMDVFDLLINMIDYFVNIGYMCFKHKSFDPILFENQTAYEMSQLHVTIQSQWPAIKDMAWELTSFKDDVDFRNNATKLIEYYKDSYKFMAKINSYEAIALMRKQSQIEEYLSELVRVMLCGELRHAPFGMLIYGGSSVGKSTLTSILTTVSIVAQGGDPDPSLRKVTNANDEFFSNYVYGTEAIILDDMCNTKLEFTKRSPLEKIIEYINNVPAYPVMADLSSKGKIPLRPKVVVATTNVADLDAGSYSNEPVSIMRRFNVCITVIVKKEFALNPEVKRAQDRMICKDRVSKFVVMMQECFKDGTLYNGKSVVEEDWLIPDIWDLELTTIVSESSMVTNAKAAIKHVPILNAKGGAVFSVKEAQEVIYRMSIEHKEQQNMVVTNIKSIPEFLADKFCSKSNVDPHMDAHVWNDADDEWASTIEMNRKFRIPGLEFLASYFNNPVIADKRWWYSSVGCGSVCMGLGFSFPMLATTSIACMWVGSRVYNAWFESKYKKYAIESYRPMIHLATTTLAYGAVFGYFVKTLWPTLRDKVKAATSPQSMLHPDTFEELKHNATRVNAWAITPLQEISTSAPKTTTADQLLSVCERNLVVVKCAGRFMNGFFLCQNILVIPTHFVNKILASDDNVVSLISSPIFKDGMAQNCHTQKFRFSTKSVLAVPNTDFSLYYVHNAMPRKDVRAHLPVVPIEREIPARMAVRDVNANVLHYSARLIPGMQDTGKEGARFQGFAYKLLDGVTFPGMCMGVWISDTSPTCISGFHLGGVSNTPTGASGILQSHVVENLIEILVSRCTSFVMPASSGHINLEFANSFDGVTEQYLDPQISDKHPVNFLPPESNILAYGTMGGTHKYHTRVVYRPLGLKFLKRHGIPLQHGAPNMNKPPKWYHFSKNIAQFSTEGMGPSVEALEWATNDYVLPILAQLRKLGFGSEEFVRPLTNLENVNGVPGVRFLDALKSDTSVGYPLKGKTSEYLIGQIGSKDFINPAFWDEVARMETEYLAGRRCYPVFQAHLKDEPVKLGKDKVRVFFGNGTPFKLIIRKYWLPIVRLLSEHSLLSECAIGINCHGVEWQEFVDFVEQHGQDRCVAGDYEGYDQKEFLNVTQASYAVYLEIAKLVGYSADMCKIMESMIADLSMFTVLYFGALLQMPRGNASGQNLTAYVNSTANSLNSRCAYYDLAPRKPPPPFRKMVAMMTYGDDDIGTVSRSCDWYTAPGKSKILAGYGINYTPPDKKGEHSVFYHSREVDFLKRRTVYIPELNRCLGALDEASVIKSISCGIPTPHLSNEELFGQVLDGALTEMFAHGRWGYESFQEKIKVFVEEEGLQRFVKSHEVSFDERVQAWLSRNETDLLHGYHTP